MSRLKVALHNDFQLLTLLRDELALQAHLFKADTKSGWEALEVKWSDLKEHMGRAQVAAGDAGRSVDDSAKQLVESLSAGYKSIKNAFKG